MLASSISYAFNPIIMWAAFLVTLFYGTQLSPEQQQALWLPIATLELIVPAILLGVFMKLGLISDVDVTNVKQRRLFFVLVLLAHTLSFALLVMYGSKESFELRGMGLAVEVVGTIITFFWKISGHLAVTSFLTGALIILLGWQWAWMLLLLPIIAWSRVVLKRHTVMQTLAGSVLPLGIMMLGILMIRFVEGTL